MAGAAAGDGLPVLGVDVGGTGVLSPAGDGRYVTIPAAGRTVLARTNPARGTVYDSKLLVGTFTIPAVAYDGSAAGLSADGRTLVLIEPRVSFPRAWTTFAVLSVPALRRARTVRLRGDFSFDAISPHGRLLYLIQYVTPTDPTRYLVRAYDLVAGRLLGKPVVDPRDRGEKMRGSPVTRATSPDGRWAYTLYDGAGAVPFVHALDTSRHTARCVDLDALAGTDVSGVRLRVAPNGDTITVENRGRPVLAIRTDGFRVVAPPLVGPPQTPDDRGAEAAWRPVVLACGCALALVVGALSVVGVRRRRRPVAAP
jgi:hypothetical protein